MPLGGYCSESMTVCAAPVRRALLDFSRSMMLHMSVLIIPLLLLLLNVAQAESPILSSDAYITRCIGTALSPEEPAGCELKLVVELTFDDSTLAFPSLEQTTTVQNVSNYAAVQEDFNTPESGRTSEVALRGFIPSFVVAMSQSMLQIHYLLSYQRQYSNTMSEVLSDQRGTYLCNTPGTECSPYTTVDGNYVSSSMGLCCSCPDIECAMSATFCNSSMLGHFCFLTATSANLCLVNGSISYGGWTIGSPSPHFTLNVSMSGTPHGDVDFQMTADDDLLTKSTSTLKQISNDASFMYPTGVSNVAGQVLFTPSFPVDNERVAAGSTEWLILPPEYVSVDGRTCDKVGISFEAYYSTLGSCKEQWGHCLHNQLENFRTIDMDGAEQGKSGRYMAPYIGNFSRYVVSDQHYLTDHVVRAGLRLLQWTASADGLPFTLYPMEAVLEDVSVETSEQTIQVKLRSLSAYAGLFYVEVKNCTFAQVASVSDTGGAIVFARSALRQIALRGNAFASLTFETAGDEIGQRATCTVELRRSDNSLAGEKIVSWVVEWLATTKAPAQSEKVMRRARCQMYSLLDVKSIFVDVCIWKTFIWFASCLAFLGIISATSYFWEYLARYYT